jgi:hypothetical protein
MPDPIVMMVVVVRAEPRCSGNRDRGRRERGGGDHAKPNASTHVVWILLIVL